MCAITEKANLSQFTGHGMTSSISSEELNDMLSLYQEGGLDLKFQPGTDNQLSQFQKDFKLHTATIQGTFPTPFAAEQLTFLYKIRDVG